MLSPEIIKKIKKVHLKSGRLVNTMMAGQYKSVFRGAGIEFEEVREYAPGDDVKSIDWNVSARLGRTYVKLYREERELIVMLLVDMSASGLFGTQENIKKETAAEFASILAFNAIRNNDKVGAILFTDRVEKYIPPKKGSAHVWRVIKEIFTFRPEHKGTDIQEAVRFLGNVSRKKTVTFLISDFLTENYLRSLVITSKKHELICVLLSDPGDFILPDGGIVTLEDFETGERLLLDASDKKTQQWYEKRQIREERKRKDDIVSSKIDCIRLSTADSVADVLTRYFRYREKRRK